MKLILITTTILIAGGITFTSYANNDCKGLSDAYCSLADTLYAKHGTKAVYSGVRDYKLNGAKPSGTTSNLFDVEFKDVVSFVKTARGLI